VLNLSREFPDIPERLKATIAQARASNLSYLILHQGT